MQAQAGPFRGPGGSDGPPPPESGGAGHGLAVHGGALRQLGDRPGGSPASIYDPRKPRRVPQGRHRPGPRRSSGRLPGDLPARTGFPLADLRKAVPPTSEHFSGSPAPLSNRRV